MVRRAWTASERRVVWTGLLGRLAIAFEPILGTLVFVGLTFGIVWRAQHVEHDIIVLAPVFAVGALGFTLYGIALLVAPLRAFLQTFEPIYIVDGYVRYRGPDQASQAHCSGYIAVLFEDRSAACEWEAFGERRLPDKTIPALVEFSTYAGIHTIDGRSTGLIGTRTTPLTVGHAPRNADVE